MRERQHESLKCESQHSRKNREMQAENVNQPQQSPPEKNILKSLYKNKYFAKLNYQKKLIHNEITRERSNKYNNDIE